MGQSVFRKVHRDILLEWVYDPINNIADSYSILINNKDRTRSYISGDLTINSLNNQLFPVDIVQNKWSKIDTTTYNFLTLQNYISDGPIQHDVIKLHFPSNYNFNEYVGILLRVYTYDFQNKKILNLSDFFFDKNDSTQSTFVDTIIPSLLYEDRLWDRELTIDIPAVSFISLQRRSGVPIPGSINDVLSNGVGLSLTSPIFIDFHFITSITQVGSNRTYKVTTPFTVEVPQEPELQQLSLYVGESQNGDYFEIYPTYNGSFEEFGTWIDQSYGINKVYITEYSVTIFEQNIKGKSIKFLIEDDFSEIVEYRPILKYSTTQASIDIEFRLIDKVDGSIIIRKAVYGLKPEQISKYSLNLKKINIKNTSKPKIYVKKKIELAEIDSLTRGNPQEVIVDVNTPMVFNLNNITAYSENDLNPKAQDTLSNFHPLGQMKILITPFDNIIKFSLAIKSSNTLEYLDLTDCQNLKLSFRSDKINYDFSLYNGETSDLKNGGCNFKIPQSAFKDLKNLWVDKNNLFYITTTNKDTRTVIYSGLFAPSDSKEAVTIFDTTIDGITNQAQATIIDDPSARLETAIVTRRQVRVN